MGKYKTLSRTTQNFIRKVLNPAFGGMKFLEKPRVLTRRASLEVAQLKERSIKNV